VGLQRPIIQQRVDQPPSGSESTQPLVSRSFDEMALEE
jgi:hypothetical protein